MIVVKVGGSLYDHPGLGPGLRVYLESLPSPVMLVPGGGAITEAVRQLDTVHCLGEVASHRLALTSLIVTGGFLRSFVPAAKWVSHPSISKIPHRGILDAAAFCQYEPNLPHTWAVTSDSIAARAAVVFGASRLVLLKSIDIPPGTPWAEAADRGWVDPHFPAAVSGHPLRVEAVNFRRWLDEHDPPESAVARRSGTPTPTPGS